MNEFNKELQVPLNVIKEKVLIALPEVEIEDDAIIVISKALNFFLNNLAKKIPIDLNCEKKILIRDIKTCIESEEVFSFLKKVIEK